MNKKGDSTVIYERISDGFIAFDKEWRFIYLNKHAERLLNRKRKDVLGKIIWKFNPHTIGTNFYKKYHEAVKNQHSVSFVEYYKLLDKWFEIRAYPSKAGLSVFFTDISQKKKIENNLQFLAHASKILSSTLDYNKTLRSVAKLAVPYIADWCVIDMINEIGELTQVEIGSVDPKKARLLKKIRQKYPINMYAKQGIAEVIRTGKSELKSTVEKDSHKKRARSSEHSRILKSLGITSTMILPIIADKKVIGVIQLVSTISKRHYTKTDLTMAEDLASRLALAITNARYYKEAQMDIERRKDLERQKNEFISIASHELKTPLTSLTAFAQLLRRQLVQLKDSQAIDYVTRMNTQLEKLVTLVADLLDVSRIEEGRLKLNKEKFSYDTFIKDVVADIQATTSSHVIKITGKVKIKIVADKFRLGQVLINLLTNSIKYSPKGGKVIVHVSKNNKEIVTSVKDFGIGIHKDRLTHLFEKFYRVQQSLPGLGLGLFISQQIIDLYHGRFWVESVEKKGSTFYFSLPLKPVKSKK